MEALADNRAPVSLGWRGLSKVCTVAQLAETFQCSRSTIYRNIYRGDGDDPYKMGAWKERGKFYIDRLEAADWFHRPMREAFKALIEVACGDAQLTLKPTESRVRKQAERDLQNHHEEQKANRAR